LAPGSVSHNNAEKKGNTGKKDFLKRLIRLENQFYITSAAIIVLRATEGETSE